MRVKNKHGNISFDTAVSSIKGNFNTPSACPIFQKENGGLALNASFMLRVYFLPLNCFFRSDSCIKYCLYEPITCFFFSSLTYCKKHLNNIIHSSYAIQRSDNLIFHVLFSVLLIACTKKSFWKRFYYFYNNSK